MPTWDVFSTDENLCRVTAFCRSVLLAGATLSVIISTAGRQHGRTSTVSLQSTSAAAKDAAVTAAAVDDDDAFTDVTCTDVMRRR